MNVAPGQALSHYRLVERIGAGGMGVVWKARDTHLDRDVALKVLSPDLLPDDAARRRFRKEALALSRLNHPNIETVFDFDTQDGVDFLVMEYIPGTTLDRKLASGPLPEKEVARLGTQLGEGLAAAHARGVLHRDLKPGNLRVTPDGRLKVLDFGLAKLLRPVEEGSRADTLTETRGVAGTLPYMAPEQLRGEAVDARADLYAAGVVLYELSTGKRPFQEKLATALADSILHKPPPPPGRLTPEISSRLEEVILKCLEKDPDRRYQSAAELLVDLRRLGAGEPTASTAAPGQRRMKGVRPLLIALAVAAVAVSGYLVRRHLGPRAIPPAGKVMLAVLPFENLSADADQEYFSDGMTEEMIAQLAQLAPRDLGVIARTSAMHYKGTRKRIDEIGRELGAQYILEGSVRRGSGRVRITAQLIQVGDQTHLWAESYERDLAGVLAIQADVARHIARSLALELLPAAQARLAGARPVDPEAHQAYLKGRFHWNKRTAADLGKAIEYFNQAIKHDPTFARGYAGLAEANVVLDEYAPVPLNVACPRAEAAALKALQLDDSLAEPHAVLAYKKCSYDWDWSGAESEFRRAIELDPGYATAHQWYSMLLSTMGRDSEAIAEIEKARDLDPLSLIINANVGQAYYKARQYGRAEHELRRTLDLDPNFGVAHSVLGRVLLAEDRPEEAILEFQRFMTLDSEPDTWNGAYLVCSNARLGRTSDSRRLLADLTGLVDRQYVDPFHLAIAHTCIGERDQALAWLEKAYAEHSSYLVEGIIEPELDSLRADPRFQNMLRRMGLSK